MGDKKERDTEDLAGGEAFEIDLEKETPLDRVFEEAVAAIDSEADPEADPEADSEAEEGGGESSRRIEELEKEVRELREGSARTLADFDNYRKRSEREKSDIRRYALTQPLRDFLDVSDNIERAMAAPGSAEDLKLGLRMTIRQLEDVLSRYGVERVEAEGKPFNPNVHEAVSREESDEVESAMVSKEVQKGFMLHDRLLRPARVIVLMPSAGAKGAEDSEEKEEAEEVDSTH